MARMGRALAVGLLGLLSIGAVTGCASVPKYNYASEPDPRAAEYEIGPLDQLRVAVWDHPELSTETTVRPDGFVTLPLIGDLRVAGQPPSAIRRECARRYSAFARVDDAAVSVAVLQVNSYTFTVRGNVEKAGVYSQKTYVTALEAIALAGGKT